MPMPPRLSVVTVGARDLPLLRRFHGALGWTEVEGSDDDWCAYLVGGVLFALYPIAELAMEAGATPIAEPRAREWGGRSGYVADPEGTRWEIAWAPSARFDERGALLGFGA
jgi:hypothetical protein